MKVRSIEPHQVDIAAATVEPLEHDPTSVRGPVGPVVLPGREPRLGSVRPDEPDTLLIDLAHERDGPGVPRGCARRGDAAGRDDEDDTEEKAHSPHAHADRLRPLR